MSRSYTPRPNPPCKPKRCQECGNRVDGVETEGWWLERENWQSPNDYVLFCLTCCVNKMNDWQNHPDVATEREVKEKFYPTVDSEHEGEERGRPSVDEEHEVEERLTD